MVIFNDARKLKELAPWKEQSTVVFMSDFGTGDGAEMWRSLGMTVVWGLSISTLITLVIIPTLYCGIYEHKEARKARKKARREAKAAVANN